jgi:outer membrane protein assembly factor BamB
MDDSYLYAFDKKTGKEIWKQKREERSGWTTPYITEASGRTQVIISGSNAIRSYDLATGELIWQCSGLGSNPVPMVVADATAVYAMSGHRPPTVAMAIQLGRTGDLTGSDAVLWKYDRGTPYVPSPLLYGDNLFFCQRNDPLITCLDKKTGQPHYAQQRLQESTGIVGVYASPIGAQGRIYLPGQNGVTVVLENATEVKVLASNKLDDGFDASPAVVDNELYLRGRSNLYCIVAN